MAGGSGGRVHGRPAVAAGGGRDDGPVRRSGGGAPPAGLPVPLVEQRPGIPAAARGTREGPPAGRSGGPAEGVAGMSSAAQEERTTLARPLLTHELGSLAKPNWRVKAFAGAPLGDRDFEEAREWGARLGVPNYQELIELLKDA